MTLLRGIDSQTTVGRIMNTLLEPRELLETRPRRARCASQGAPARFGAHAGLGYWGRVKRVMLGVSAPTVEGS